MRRLALLTALLGLLVPVSVAHAAFPGTDGKIAYTYTDFETDNTSVCVISDQGSGSTCLINGLAEGPSWSPNGAQLAFGHVGDIATMNADGTGVVHVTNTPSEIEFEPAWAPSGEQLAFTVDAGTPLQIHRIDVDGSDRTSLTNAASDSEDPAWSWPPAAARIAFARDTGSGRDIYTMNADGTDEVNLTNTPGVDESAPNWSHDRTKLAFSSSGGVWVMNADGSGRVRLADGSDPAWSPSGRSIVYTQIYTQFGTGNVYSLLRTMLSSGGNERTIASELASQADFSAPDWQPVAPQSFVRPAGATPFRVPLVPAFQSCLGPNREHGPALAFGSCAPPVAASTNLTVGVGDGSPALSRSVGSLRLGVIKGAVAGPDDSDVRIRFSLSNVMRTGDLSEYTGELRTTAGVRLTGYDSNQAPMSQTTQDFPFEFDVPCVPTAEVLDKSVCELTTSIDTVLPGAVAERVRSIWALDQVKVYDGGADGDADTTADNSLFAVQGVFVP